MTTIPREPWTTRVEPPPFRVSAEGCAALLALARRRIARAISAPVLDDPACPAELRAEAAAFVTLTEQGRLRGCIGMTSPRGALYDAVAEMAVAAATSDPRFPPVRPEELEALRIEISVLSPLSRIASAAAIEPGIHGVSIRKGSRRGLFLPQVWEQLPGKEDFLGELCSQKAGLDRDAWKSSDVELYTFTVFSFEERP